MAKAPAWVPPPAPDMRALARECYQTWLADQPTTLAFDTETTGLEYHDDAFCGTFAWRRPDGTVFGGYLEWIVSGDVMDDVEAEAFTYQTRDLSLRMLRHARVLVAHNAKFDLHRVERALGFRLADDQVLHDTECMAHLDDEHRPKGLKELAVSVLGFDDLMDVPGNEKNPDYDPSDPESKKMRPVIRRKPKSEYLVDKAREAVKKQLGLRSVKDVGYHLLPRGIVTPYAILDAVWTLDLARILWPKVSQWEDLTALYWQEMMLTRTAIYDMEKSGLKVRMDYVGEQVKHYRKLALAHEAKIEQLVAKPVRTGKIDKKERHLFFNPSASSPDAAAFFEAHGLGRDNYDAEALGTIDHPLATTLLAYRKDIKILDGYFIALQKAVGADGIFHQSSRQHGTVSGRTSGGKERGDQ
jgi:DNA polymerase I-like protein with 3'-5' exonuclease and polymerase domains